MSLGEEADNPNTEGRHTAPGEPMDLDKLDTPDERQPVEETPELSPLPVIVSPDGSVAIDGVPVPLVAGEAVDVAILDTLHGYARSRNAPVRAAISDPSADYVALVQVDPDGSSRLVEQRQEGPSGAGGYTGPVGPEGFPENSESRESGEGAETTGFAEFAAGSVGPVEYPGLSGDGLSSGDDEAAMTGDETARTPEPARPRISAPALPSGRGLGSARKKLLRQSDDEYQPPGFLKRPLGVGAAGVVTAAVIVVPLIVLGSSSGGEDRNSAADSTKVEAKDKAPSTPLPPPPAGSGSRTSPPRPPSASVSASDVPKPKKAKKPAAKAEAKKPAAKAEKPEPTRRPETELGSGIPDGEVLIKNKKYGFCLDLPGTGKGTFDTPVQDGACHRSSSDNQEWVLEVAAEGGGPLGSDLYLIKNAKSGLCLDLSGYGAVRIPTAVGLFNCNPSNEEDNQLWWLDKRPDDTYWIRNRRNGDTCLDVARSDKKAAHKNITIFGCSEFDDHEWSFSAD
ncbi:RICIN domain-containing protein [Streptomyces mirabilis]